MSERLYRKKRHHKPVQQRPAYDYGEVQYELFPGLKIEWGSPYRDPAKDQENW